MLKELGGHILLASGVVFTTTVEFIDMGLKMLLLTATLIFTIYKILDLRHQRNERLKK
jgi:hypothetical protein